jgi:UDP:flavonoid glycosyltransferase YjiC (YdhE family)
VAALNNSDVVVTEYLRRPGLPSSIRSQFWLVEFWDYTFHKHMVNLVISPSLRDEPARHPNFHRVGVMLREAFENVVQPGGKAAYTLPKDVKRAVFMLSGSVFASKIAGNFSDLPFHVDVVGREGESRGNVTYHGKALNSFDILCKADFLVINGGFLAVSEAAVLRKPTFVIPVPNHAEQVINSLLLQDLGIGYVATEATVIGQIQKALESNRWEGLREDIPQVNFNGSAEAALAVMGLARDRGRV